MKRLVARELGRGVPGGPAPPQRSRDPATLLESLRAGEGRSALPHGDRLGSRLGLPLCGLEVYRGAAARRVCELLGARALAAGQVLVFAEDAPSLGTVAHELAHVLQQGGHRSRVARFAPGSLGTAASEAAAEREAEAFARGALPLGRLSRAPLAVYRASIPSGLDADEQDLEEDELRFKEFLEKGGDLAITEPPEPVFCREKDETVDPPTVSGRYQRSSARKFAHAEYAKIAKGAVDGELPRIWRRGSKWRLSKVGFKEEEARKYAVTGSGPYQDTVYEVATPERKEPTPEDNAQALRDYRKAVRAIANKKLQRWEQSWKPKVAKVTAVTAEELSVARDALEDRIVQEYSPNDVDGLFDEVIQPAVFAPPYTRIQGNIFEKWVKANRPGWVKGSGQPLFSDPIITKDRFGDLVIRRGPLLIIGEVKAVAGAPGPPEKAQMRDYFLILSKKLVGRYLEDPEDPKTAVSATFQRVKYFFPQAGPDGKEIVRKWMPSLLAAFKKDLSLFETEPVSPKALPKKTVKQKGKANPYLEVTVENADDEANLTHRLENPPGGAPGVKLRLWEVTLREAGFPAITAGQFSMELDVKGPLASEAPTAKTLTPIEPVEGGPDADLVGTTDAAVEQVKPSGLDKFLQRVHTEVKLTDDGIAGRIWVDPGESFVKQLTLDQAEIEASYTRRKGFAASGTVAVSYARAPDKFKGRVTVRYARERWSFEGKGTVAGLIEGLDPFDVVIRHADDVTTIGAEKLKLRRKIAGIELAGGVKKLEYDVATGFFNADGIHFDVELGPFGKVGADASIRQNELEKLSFDYTGKELRYPKARPIFTGKLTGGATYEKGRWGGHVGGTAYLQIPALQRISRSLGDLGFTVDVGIDPEGRYSGSIALAEDKPILLGSYLRIPTLKLALDAQGGITSTFGIEVTEKLKYVRNAGVICRITREGRFEILEARGKVKIGDEKKDRIAAELGLLYSREKDALVVTGKVWVRIKKGLVASGELTWNSATNTVEGVLRIDRIQLLQWKGHKPLFKVKKQIILVSIYGLGIYLDLRFELGFNYRFELGLTPEVRLTGLKLDDFTFALAVATVTLDGILEAELVGKPAIGLGLYALHPKLLRGGGGLALPVSAKATVNPRGKVVISYRPDETVEGKARVGLVLTFGITAALEAYAEFSVLDGVYEPTWESGPLAEFTILEPRELFTYYVDFGGSLEKTEGEPAMPAEGESRRPPGRASDEKERIESRQPAPATTDKPPRGKRDEKLPKDPEEKPKEAKKEGGFDFGTMVARLLDSPKFRPIKKVLDAASATFEAIAEGLDAIKSFFTKWLSWIGEAVDAIVEAIRIIAKDGLIAYFKQLLKRKLGAFFDIIEPLFVALEKVAGRFEDQIAKLMKDPIPLTPIAFLKWVVRTLATIFGIAVSGIREFVRALRKVYENALDAFLGFVNHLVQEGKVGVRRHVYYIPGIRSNTYFYAATEYKIHLWGFRRKEKVDGDLVGWRDVTSPSRVVHKAIAFLLYEFLDAFPEKIKPTRVEPDDPDVDDDTRRDFWVHGGEQD